MAPALRCCDDAVAYAVAVDDPSRLGRHAEDLQELHRVHQERVPAFRLQQQAVDLHLPRIHRDDCLRHSLQGVVLPFLTAAELQSDVAHASARRNSLDDPNWTRPAFPLPEVAELGVPTGIATVHPAVAGSGVRSNSSMDVEPVAMALLDPQSECPSLPGAVARSVQRALTGQMARCRLVAEWVALRLGEDAR